MSETEVHTFLIADVRGYTRFTVEHGDAAAAQLAEKFADLARVVVTARDGEVLELRGDEALAVFSSSRQALWAATELQSRVTEESVAEPSLAMRIGIGIDAGEAIPVAGGYRGAALNLAARLCSLAGPGEVLASETVTSLARKLEGLEYTERGMVQLKGFTDPVRVVQVLAEAVIQEETPPSALEPAELPMPIGGFLGALPAGMLVARDEELARVLTSVDAVSGGSGRLVLLAGEPGAGKTRVAQEVTLQVRNRGFLIGTGICYEPRESVPYYPFLDALATLYGGAPPAIRSSVPQRWPYLGRLLPEAGFVAPPAGSEGEREQERLFRAVAGFIQAIAETGPVALLLDDLHWADASSLELLQHLAKHTRGYRVLILGTYRDVEVGRQHPLERALLDLTREQLVERVAIRRLDPAGTASLIAATMGDEEVSDEFAGLVHRHTEGNPFFTQQVLQAMVEQGDIFRRDDRWDRRKVEEIQVPESVRAVIGQRLSRLGQEAQELLREASVLGPTFIFDDLQTLSGREEDQVEEALDEATAAGLVRETDANGYAFHHALTQQALYGELSSRRKRRLHLAAGEAIESLPARKRNDRVAELAWHFLAGDDPERALHYSLLAGDQAEAVFAHREAQRHYRTALELAREQDDRPHLAKASFKLGEVLSHTHELQQALPVLEEAASLYAALGDPVMEGRALQPTAFIYNLTGSRERAAETIDRVELLLDAIAVREPSRDQVMFYYELTRYYAARVGDLSKALALAERAVNAARAVGDETLVARTELRRAEALGGMGRVRDAIAVAEQVLPRAEEAGDLETLTEALGAAAEFSMLAGEFQESRTYRDKEHELHGQVGHAFQEAFSLVNLAQVSLYQGEWDVSRDYAEQALARGQDIGNGFVIQSAKSWLGELALGRGALEEASHLLEEAAVETAGTLQIHRYIQRGLAQRDILLGRPEAARDRLEPLVEGTDSDNNDIVFLLPVLAWAYVLSGDVERGASVATEAVERATAREYALALVDALRVLGIARAHQERWGEAARALEEGVALARRMPYPYAEARAQYEMGMLNVGRGNHEQARERLEESLAIFQRLGARKDVERAEETLSTLTGQSSFTQ